MNINIHRHFQRLILLASLVLPASLLLAENTTQPTTAPTTLPIGPDGLILESDNAHPPYMAVYKGSVNGIAKPYGIQRAEAYAAWLNRSLIWAEDTLPAPVGITSKAKAAGNLSHGASGWRRIPHAARFGRSPSSPATGMAAAPRKATTPISPSPWSWVPPDNSTNTIRDWPRDWSKIIWKTASSV